MTTPPDSNKAPPPLTPKDSLIVGWMDPNGELIPFTIKERIEALEKENIELRNERDELKGLLKSSLAVAQQEAEAAQEENKRFREALKLAMGGLKVYADLTDEEKGTRYWAEHIIKEIKTAGV